MQETQQPHTLGSASISAEHAHLEGKTLADNVKSASGLLDDGLCNILRLSQLVGQRLLRSPFQISTLFSPDTSLTALAQDHTGASIRIHPSFPLPCLLIIRCTPYIESVGIFLPHTNDSSHGPSPTACSAQEDRPHFLCLGQLKTWRKSGVTNGPTRPGHDILRNINPVFKYIGRPEDSVS